MQCQSRDAFSTPTPSSAPFFGPLSYLCQTYHGSSCETFSAPRRRRWPTRSSRCCLDRLRTPHPPESVASSRVPSGLRSPIAERRMRNMAAVLFGRAALIWGTLRYLLRRSRAHFHFIFIFIVSSVGLYGRYYSITHTHTQRHRHMY